MPVFLVNGSPKALAAAFCQSPPKTKAVMGCGAASALAKAPNNADSAEPPNAPPSARMNSLRPSPRVSSNTAPRRAHVSSTPKSRCLNVIARTPALSVAPARQRLRARDAHESQNRQPDQDRGSSRNRRVRRRLNVRPDFHRDRLADAAQHEHRDEQLVRRMHESKDRADDDAWRDDRQRYADNRPQRRSAMNDRGPFQIAVGAAQTCGGVDHYERHAADRVRAGQTYDRVVQAERNEEQIG